MKSLEEHLADFILNNHRDKESLAYRRTNMELWKREYGEAFAMRVENLIKKGWKK